MCRNINSYLTDAWYFVDAYEFNCAYYKYLEVFICLRLDIPTYEPYLTVCICIYYICVDM